MRRFAFAAACGLGVFAVLRLQERDRVRHAAEVAQVGFESALLAKQLTYAELEAAEGRARHERDMRQAALAAAAELGAARDAAPKPEPPKPAPKPEPPKPAPRPEPPKKPAPEPPHAPAPRPPTPDPPPPPPPPSSAGRHLPYLRDPASTAPRRRVNVAVYLRRRRR